jgi:hypothetical protein
MNSLIKAVALAVIVAAPVASFAQSNDQPLTRAQVRAELAQLNQAGYHAGGRDPYYPSDIQAAEARAGEGAVAQGNATPAPTADVGGTVGSTTRFGGPAAATGTKSIYFGQ